MHILKTVLNKLPAALVMATVLAGCVQTTPTPSNKPVLAPAPTAPQPPKVVMDLQPPVWKKDHTWVYSDGYALQVEKVFPNGNAKLVRLDVPKTWVVRKAIFKQESSNPRAHRLVVFRTLDPMTLFKVQAGQSIHFIREYTKNKKLIRHKTSWTIEGKEQISVPAGTFDTWVIVMRTESLDTNWVGFERWWYSADVNNYVRMEYKYGDSQASSRVLMSYTH
ncbi:MAG: hypothetical protein COB46_05960 [Rhodospirillaceae bacterium]|nr:MAG: hypothetical protein COB46_05960 [Rhodospirillaceae bacterium]